MNYKPHFKYTPSSPFNGVLKNLPNNSFRITSSSVYKNQNDSSPLNVIKYDDLENSFSSEDIPNSWICFEFVNSKIKVETYEIRSSKFQTGLSHLKSWVIEGSNSGYSWEIIDEEENCKSLNGSNYTCVFNIQSTKAFRFIRLRQISKNWRNRNYLKFNSIEFYGKIE